MIYQRICNLDEYTTSMIKTISKALSVELLRESLHGRGNNRVFPGCCSHFYNLFERVRNQNNKYKTSCYLLHEL